MGKPTRETMARALALEAAEFFDGLAEREESLTAADMIAAADYASRVAGQLHKWGNAMEADARKRADNVTKHTDENGVLCIVRGA